MKKKNLVIMLGSMLVLTTLTAGCVGQDSSNQEKEDTTQESIQDAIEEETMSVEETEQGGQQEETQNVRKPHYEGSEFSWGDITITIPKDWEGKYFAKEFEDGSGISFFQTASYEKEEGMGYLCAFSMAEGPVYEMAGERQLAYTDGEMFYMAVPTDVTCYLEDEAITKEYGEMFQYVYDMGDSIQIHNRNGVHYDPREYVFPMSDTCILDEGIIGAFDDNQLCLGEKEILARHGAMFERVYVQNHFDTCSWYQGKVAENEFDLSTLNEVEQKNLEIIRSAQDTVSKERPYPQKVMADTEVSMDLEGKGSDVTLQYHAEMEMLDDVETPEVVVTIDGTPYDLTKAVGMDNPLMEYCYITDISSYDAGLEIAVLDYGPSDDCVTYFFTYDRERDNAVQYVGMVGGFPFVEEGSPNGFAMDGCVDSEIYVGLIETVYGRQINWYDYDNQELVPRDGGWYPLTMCTEHTLYEDLPVYLSADESAIQYTISANQTVYFVGTDAEEWIEVKTKQGEHAYFRVVDDIVEGTGKTSQEVFSDLHFAG